MNDYAFRQAITFVSTDSYWQIFSGKLQIAGTPIDGCQLNYMLIDDAIEAAKAAGKLFPVRPTVPWAGEPRAFLMCSALYKTIAIGKTSRDERARRRWATLEADMSYFIEGGLITEDLLKQLKPFPYEHWELRSRKPKPSLRVFGRFAKPNVFVGTHVDRRDRLGGMWSPEFEHEKLVCEDHWNDAGLPKPFTHPRFEYEAYITENAIRKLKVQR